MKILGLTGGSGAGKGCVAELFAAHGIPTLDTDQVSRAVCAPSMPCTKALAEAFGADILDEGGALRRAELARRVFLEEDPYLQKEKKDTLNRITHYYILEAVRTWLGERAEEGCKAACVDAPQLFESGFDGECDRILAVTAHRELRIRRIMERDGITRELAEGRIDAQHDDDFFRERCHVVLYNNGTKEDLQKAVTNTLSRWGLLS